MALNPSNSSDLQQLALKGLTRCDKLAADGDRHVGICASRDNWRTCWNFVYTWSLGCVFVRNLASTSTFARRGAIQSSASTHQRQICPYTYLIVLSISSGCRTSTFRTRRTQGHHPIRHRTEAFASIQMAQFDMWQGRIIVSNGKLFLSPSYVNVFE